MAYAITGLPADSFRPLFTLSDDALAECNARRVTVTGPGFPCRITLEDAAVGEEVILLNHISHDVATPYRSSYAIYVRDVDGAAAHFVDEPAPVMATRPLGLRGFDTDGMLRDARLALPGQADAMIRSLFDNAQVAYIHAHNAAHGCFSARIDRA